MSQGSWENFLGLANRARKVVSGEELVVKEIRRSSAKLVLLSKDAAENTMKKVTDKCKSYHIPYQLVANRAVLGKAIGKEERVVVAITDDGFAKKMKELLGVIE